jgi:hypothetical protein
MCQEPATISSEPSTLDIPAPSPMDSTPLFPYAIPFSPLPLPIQLDKLILYDSLSYLDHDREAQQIDELIAQLAINPGPHFHITPGGGSLGLVHVGWSG